MTHPFANQLTPRSHRACQLGGTAPADADEEALLEALRAAAADRRVLLVIDDAWQVEHERALFCLDEATGSACLVTTRVGSLVKGYFELVKGHF